MHPYWNHPYLDSISRASSYSQGAPFTVYQKHLFVPSYRRTMYCMSWNSLSQVSLHPGKEANQLSASPEWHESKAWVKSPPYPTTPRVTPYNAEHPQPSHHVGGNPQQTMVDILTTRGTPPPNKCKWEKLHHLTPPRAIWQCGVKQVHLFPYFRMCH